MSKILGINQRFYPAQFGFKGIDRISGGLNAGGFAVALNPPATVAVLVEGEIGDYACYVGHGEPEFVAAHGDKIRFAEAKCHFPGLEENKYRE